MRGALLGTVVIWMSAVILSGETQMQEDTKVNEVARSAIKSIDINAPVDEVFGFVSNPMNWPQWAVVNIKSVQPGRDGWFKTVTTFGEGELKMNATPAYGLFDHIWKDPQATWTVPARVVSNGPGSTVMMTIFKPSVMTDAQFDEAMVQMDVEMKKLKEVLERPVNSK